MEEPPFRDRRDDFTLDPRQREIRELLKLIGPEPTQCFTDACRIIAGAAGVTMQTHLAAHSLREIEGRLHDVLEPMLSRERKAKIAEADERKESHRAKIEVAAEILSLPGWSRLRPLCSTNAPPKTVVGNPASLSLRL